MGVRLNSIQFATIFQQALDKQMMHTMLTGWMDANAGQVKYNGGKEIKIPIITVDGLADYGRTTGTGFVGGKATITYKTYEMTQDRGRSFSLDRHDVDESNYVATMGNIMGEFQRTQVVPEVDAYRISKCIANATTVGEGDTNAKWSVTITKENALSELKGAIKAIREQGYNGEIVVHCTYDFQLALEEQCAGKITTVTFKNGGIDTTVPAVDGCILIPTPSNYMVSAIKLNSGGSSEEAGGFTTGVSAKKCNFIAIGKTVPIAVTKQDKVRTFTPDENQSMDAWKSDYRRYHDLFILENKKTLMFANMSEAKA